MTNSLEPDMDHAREASLMAHSVVIKLKEMGLPSNPGYDEDLARGVHRPGRHLGGAQGTVRGVGGPAEDVAELG